mmetsp:Transcript_13694/g.36939  ORF Transcript_13694/g.36939 Transcript_13694/m.36939 type:complete len:369 (+) Transcript_13694:199-1305(+)
MSLCNVAWASFFDSLSPLLMDGPAKPVEFLFQNSAKSRKFFFLGTASTDCEAWSASSAQDGLTQLTRGFLSRTSFSGASMDPFLAGTLLFSSTALLIQDEATFDVVVGALDETAGSREPFSRAFAASMAAVVSATDFRRTFAAVVALLASASALCRTSRCLASSGEASSEGWRGRAGAETFGATFGAGSGAGAEDGSLLSASACVSAVASTGASAGASCSAGRSSSSRLGHAGVSVRAWAGASSSACRSSSCLRSAGDSWISAVALSVAGALSEPSTHRSTAWGCSPLSSSAAAAAQSSAEVDRTWAAGPRSTAASTSPWVSSASVTGSVSHEAATTGPPCTASVSAFLSSSRSGAGSGAEDFCSSAG